MIAVEIKIFLSPSKITEFYAALGQFIIYRIALQKQEANRTLYLAVPSTVYNEFFILPFIQSVIQTNQLCLLIYNIEQEANAYGTLRERPMAKLDIFFVFCCPLT
ncbi:MULTISPECIES: element excision factor XisH family protein [unclassified Nostoc]|uniref:element excision factor XisH family protein n=1 Tax=unclassified Nostoc TaxID=2593658 RepID=UPI000B95AB34|nr:element excision factor XisH family protein [Nostoc sp. 'Peltigera membranacea cyanobiont' 232]OYE04521.1 hypothetical protein CDG79_12940 [Nostoc sp. 'Peltigera membranacea cyanobiont' 232]